MWSRLTLSHSSIRLRRNRTLSVKEIVRRLNVALKGYYEYYCVSDNAEAVKAFVWRLVKILVKWLNRRSQRRSLSWVEYHDSWIKQALEKPRDPKKV